MEQNKRDSKLEKRFLDYLSQGDFRRQIDIAERIGLNVILNGQTNYTEARELVKIFNKSFNKNFKI